jgi:hypothetical protein
VKPKADGPKKQAFVERIELQPLDPVTNGPQLLYGLRYHTYITKPGLTKLYHDQVGYWLWEPAAGTVIQTLTIPRGQTAMAVGKASADSRRFELVAKRGTEVYGICSNPFLEYAFKTVEYRIQVTINDDGTWSYDEDTLLMIRGQTELVPSHRPEHADPDRAADAESACREVTRLGRSGRLALVAGLLVEFLLLILVARSAATRLGMAGRPAAIALATAAALAAGLRR